MSRTLPVIIIGAGGHAAAVADALLAAGREILGFTDADSARHGRVLCGHAVLGDDCVLESYMPDAFELCNGIGGVGRESELPSRRALQQRLTASGWRFTGVRHPDASISPFATIDATAQMMAGSRVQPGAVIGEGCIVNTLAIVEHGAQLEGWSHAASGAVLCGEVCVGAMSHIGAGAIVRQGIRLGERTIVAAGAVVVRNFRGGGVLVGLPAQELGRK